ncbi:hypothetical protein ACHAXA_011269 [Cyclostephanos tholiformis]|uniref:Carbohydrate-binding module family 96 domain-containing protein n=1 Tax=Cyclostephanos tholiformis TaxID=382380 RepID=A0ABD3SPE2_9STRA
MVYRWDDLQRNNLAVDWGENVQGNVRNTRRPRALGYGPSDEQSLPNAFVVIFTLVAIGMAALLSMTLIKSPISDDEGNASEAQGMVAAVVTQIHPSISPSASPSPSIASSVPPTFIPSDHPSVSAPPSIGSSMIPSYGPTDDPGPAECVDEHGLYRNHQGDMVSCDWFATVGTYEWICTKTEIGKACLKTCREYNDCYVITHSPMPSAAPTVSPTPVRPKSITLNCTGDATISEGIADANLGSSSFLKIDSSPRPSIASRIAGIGNSGAYHVLLRFDLSKHESSRPIESAILRLKVAKGCYSGGYVQRTVNQHWDETTVTWETAPEGDGTDIDRLGEVRSGFWYYLDVTSALVESARLGVVWKETLSLRLYPVGVDECIYESKESKDGGGPELHIEYTGV